MRRNNILLYHCLRAIYVHCNMHPNYTTTTAAHIALVPCYCKGLLTCDMWRHMCILAPLCGAGYRDQFETTRTVDCALHRPYHVKLQYHRCAVQHSQLLVCHFCTDLAGCPASPPSSCPTWQPAQERSRSLPQRPLRRTVVSCCRGRGPLALVSIMVPRGTHGAAEAIHTSRHLE